MSEETKQKCFRVLEATHVRCVEERGTWYRPEFAFLVEYAGSFLWAAPYRQLLLDARPSLRQLAELYERAPIEEFGTIFIGHKLTENLQAAFPDREMHDVWLSYFSGEITGAGIEPDLHEWDEFSDVPEGNPCWLACSRSEFVPCRPDFDIRSPQSARILHAELGQLLDKVSERESEP